MDYQNLRDALGLEEFLSFLQEKLESIDSSLKKESQDLSALKNKVDLMEEDIEKGKKERKEIQESLDRIESKLKDLENQALKANRNSHAPKKKESKPKKDPNDGKIYQNLSISKENKIH